MGDAVEWRLIPSLPDYEVSEVGDVRRARDGITRKAGNQLSGTLRKEGYITFCLKADGKYKQIYAHRLVCEAWHGPPDAMRPYVAHWDGDRVNNHHSNLRWASTKENQWDRKRHNTDPSGSRNGRSILDEEKVKEIRGRFNGQRGQIAGMAREYGMSEAGMHKVVYGYNWKGVN